MSLSQLLNNFLNFREFEPQLLINSILIRKNRCNQLPRSQWPAGLVDGGGAPGGLGRCLTGRGLEGQSRGLGVRLLLLPFPALLLLPHLPETLLLALQLRFPVRHREVFSTADGIYRVFGGLSNWY